MEAEAKKPTAKRIILIVALVLACAALAAVLYFRFFADTSGVASPKDGGSIDTAVLYCKGDDERYKDVLSLLEQSTVPNLTVVAIDVDEPYTLDGIEIIYPDHSIVSSPNAETVKANINTFAENGGAVFLTNDFYDFFDKAFFGAADFVKLEYLPAGMAFPEEGDDLKGVQDVISGFLTLFNSYTDVNTLAGYDYGYGLIADTAVPIAVSGETALYTINRSGKGYVMFTNPLLPNVYSINGTDMTSKSDSQTSFANTTNSANRLIYDAFAQYVSKQEYGFALTTVYGSFGRPNMAWELHLEDIDAIANNSITLFSELAREHNQIPSFSLIRNSYAWLRRFETVTYALGEADGAYSADLYEGVYSDGSHVASGGRWLSFAEVVEDAGYFEDVSELTQTAGVWAGDFDGDSMPDLICGSSDGSVYLCVGKGFENGKFVVGEKTKLMTSDGEAVNVGADAAPVAVDANGDGITDLVIGAGQGTVYVAYGTGGDNTFGAPEVLVQTSITGRTFPEVADFDGDGRPDLLVGSNEGKLLEYVGGDVDDLNVSDANAADLSVAVADLGTWIAPRLFDIDGDGANEIMVGTVEGYVAKADLEGGAIGAFEYYTGSETNLNDNKNLKFGNNAVPFFADVNADGLADLLVGSLEYGLAYPIDSQYFPYASELQSQIDYLKENDFFLEPHFLTNIYASAEREQQEIKDHLAAMEKYGYDVGGDFGTNQHTWHLSWNSQTQTMDNLYDAGFKWNSGFEPVNSDIQPQIAAENVLCLPFYMMRGGAQTIMIQNCSTVPYDTGEWTRLSARFDIPVLCYYHCDLIWQDDTEARDFAAKAAAFQSENNYNFVTEEQMMKANAAALHLTVAADKTAGGRGFDLTLTPSQSAEDYNLYDQAYAASCGYKISLGEKLSEQIISTDAKVWYRNGSDIYVSGDAPVRIFASAKEDEAAHLERVNIAAVVTRTQTGADVEFKDDGMMQIAVSGAASTDAEGWDVKEENGRTVFTKFGKAETISINY